MLANTIRHWIRVARERGGGNSFPFLLKPPTNILSAMSGKPSEENKGTVQTSIFGSILSKMSKQTLVTIILVMGSFMLGGVGLNTLQSFGDEILAEQTTQALSKSSEALVNVLQESIEEARLDRLQMNKILLNHSLVIDTLQGQVTNIRSELTNQIARGTGSLEDQIEDLEREQKETLNQILNALKDQ